MNELLTSSQDLYSYLVRNNLQKHLPELASIESNLAKANIYPSLTKINGVCDAIESKGNHISATEMILGCFQTIHRPVINIIESRAGKLSWYYGFGHLSNNQTGPAPMSHGQLLKNIWSANYPSHELVGEKKAGEFFRPLAEKLFDYKHYISLIGVPFPFYKDSPETFLPTRDDVFRSLANHDFIFMVVGNLLPHDHTAGWIHFLSDALTNVSKHKESSHTSENSKSHSVANGSSNTYSLIIYSHSSNKQVSNGSAESQSSSFTVQNRHIELVYDYLKANQERFIEGERAGLWDVGAYIAADSPEQAETVASIIGGLYSVGKYKAERFQAIRIPQEQSNNVAKLLEAGQPVIYKNNSDPFFKGLTTPLTTSEFAVLLHPPARDVPGITRLSPARYSANSIDGVDGRSIRLGFMQPDAMPSTERLIIPREDMTQHVFVAGTTGSGKTNTTLSILAQAELPFLVMEPVKTHYRHLQGHFPDLQVYSLARQNGKILRLNPFRPVPGFQLLSHIDLLNNLLSATFPMYGSMPYLLEEAIHNLYISQGWNLEDSSNELFLAGEPLYPMLEDLINQIELVVNKKGYDERLRNDLTAALKARLTSLLQGSKKELFSSEDPIPFEELFNGHVVVEMALLTSETEKAFLMGLLLIWLYEYREVASQNRLKENPEKMECPLEHLTVIEEAHHLLRNLPSSENQEIVSIRSKAVEAFSSQLAELRALGEGFIIVDQSPVKLAQDVIKNTGLKIIHRLYSGDDREVVSQAIDLDEEQSRNLVHLKTLDEGAQAVVFSPRLDLAARIVVERFKPIRSNTVSSMTKKKLPQIKVQTRAARTLLIAVLLGKYDFAETIHDKLSEKLPTLDGISTVARILARPIAFPHTTKVNVNCSEIIISIEKALDRTVIGENLKAAHEQMIKATGLPFDEAQHFLVARSLRQFVSPIQLDKLLKSPADNIKPFFVTADRAGWHEFDRVLWSLLEDGLDSGLCRAELAGTIHFHILYYWVSSQQKGYEITEIIDSMIDALVPDGGEEQ